LAVFLTIRRPCTDFPTRSSACLPAACLPAYLPTYLPACLPTYLPTHPPTCLCVSVRFNLEEGSARSKTLIDSNRSLWPFAGCPSCLLPMSVIGALRRSRGTIAWASSDQSRRRGKPVAEAPNRRLAVFPIIRRPCADFPTRPSGCLPDYLLTCLPAYLPTYLPTCLPACLPACLPTYLYQVIQTVVVWFWDGRLVLVTVV
jgi:hypothetical protein